MAGMKRHSSAAGSKIYKYGVSWQVVPTILIKMLTDPDSEKSQRAMAAMLQMKKIDIEKLKRAYAG